MWLSFIEVIGIVTHTLKLLAHVILDLRIYIVRLLNKKGQQLLIGVVYYDALQLEADVLFLFTGVF